MLSATRVAPDMTTTPDQHLVARCLAGDPTALTALVERYQREVYGACLRIVGEPDAALELANVVFFKAYQHLQTYDASRPLRPWLLRIATNEALTYVGGQRRERDRTVPGPAGERLAETLPSAEDPAADVLADEQREAVRAAVARLPDRYRLLIVLRFFHDLSYAEITEHTGLPLNTVGVQLGRARALLRRALAGQEVLDADPS